MPYSSESERIKVSEMRRATLLLVIPLLLLSGWSNVLAATLCPHMMHDHSCCPAGKHSDSSHEQIVAAHDEMAMSEMGEMGDMGGMEMTPAPVKPSEDVVNNAISQPINQCAHCLSHSAPTTTTSIIGSVNQAKRDGEAPALQVLNQFVPKLQPAVLLISARQHAPPGVHLTPRHILIGVFRI